MRQLKTIPTKFQWLSRLNYFYDRQEVILEGFRQYLKDSLLFSYYRVLETITADVYCSLDCLNVYQCEFFYIDDFNRRYRKEAISSFLIDYLKVSSISFTIVNDDENKILILRLFTKPVLISD